MHSNALYRGVLLVCTVGSVFTASSHFESARGNAPDPAFLKVQLQKSRRSMSAAENLNTQEAMTMAQARACDRSQVHRNLTRADLLLVIPASIDRLDLARASRAWRKGVPTAFIMDQELQLLQNASSIQEDLASNLEFWASSADVAPTNNLTEKAGDFRAALAPFLANKTAAPNSYKWMLYGDDDTFWFIDNALVYLSQLDPDMPYLLSDNLWMKEHGSDTAVHPNPKAPRCLPCGYEDPLQAHVPKGSFNAPRGCPCDSALLCEADVNSVMYDHDDCGAEWPYVDHVPSPVIDTHQRFAKISLGYWYFIHGGAGAIMSQGLMQRSTYEQCRDFLFGPMPRMSGDAMFTLMVWHMMGIPPTDPGYGFYRPHVQMMDPGWLAGRTQRGPEDQGTWDGGNDPVGVVKRFQQALHNTADDYTLEQLDHVLTVHFRGRYAADDVAQVSPDHAYHGNFKATVHLHHHMAHLYDQYISMCPTSNATTKLRM